MQGDVNIETLIAARPDVVLMAYGGTWPKWTASADTYHIPVFLMPNTSLADLKTTARMTGEILGPRESARAAEWIRYFDDNIRRVTAVTSHIPASERPRVLHTATGTILTIDGVKTVIDDWITAAGGVNAATVVGNGRPVSMEQISAWNPDYPDRFQDLDLRKETKAFYAKFFNYTLSDAEYHAIMRAAAS